MSTRAVYTFKTPSEWDQSEVHIYKHHDGYPKGGLTFIKEAFAYYINNYETMKHLVNRDALSTCFLLSINKGEKYGGCDITEHHNKHGDIEYRYEITPLKDFKEIPTLTNIAIKIYSCASWEGEERLIFGGDLHQAVSKFQTLEVA
jgi:hypothetical protein